MNPGTQIVVHSLLLVLQQHQHMAQEAGLRLIPMVAPDKKLKCQQNPTEDQFEASKSCGQPQNEAVRTIWKERNTARSKHLR